MYTCIRTYERCYVIVSDRIVEGAWFHWPFVQIDTGCQGGWPDLERSSCSRGRSDMASGKSAASSNGGETEANMRAVGPYLLQRTLGKGQTGEREREIVHS